MAHSNGTTPQRHFSARELAQQYRERTLRAWHSKELDQDFLIRQRTGAEAAALSDEATALARDQEQYAGTPDAPGSAENLRMSLRAIIPILLDPDSREPYFGIDEVDDLMELPMPVLTELIQGVNEIATFTQEAADAQEKNSARTGDGNTSSVSPSAAETSTSSPPPTP